MNRFPGFLTLVMVAAVSFSAYVWVSQYQERMRLATQLQDLQVVLRRQNAAANQGADKTIKSIEASVVKNQRQAKDLAVLQTCQALRRRTATLLDTLQAHQNRLFCYTGNSASSPRLAYPLAVALVQQGWGSGTSAHRLLKEQFDKYRTSLPVLAADSLKVETPSFDSQSVAGALATFAQTESDLLAAETKALHQLSRKVGARHILTRIVPVATAESNVVHLGGTYRARFYLVKQLLIPRKNLQMECDGQPVDVDKDGVGYVRFVAPQRPGPAVWTGSIRFNINGRDTTFQTRVPYRVARQ
ncbi:MAG TPA: hypothetical protein VF629_23415 [Hymenobacter sp.]|jgi:hypothetical protein|uniref:hypothetical protein n=1 Tax=Hymenobacter sp. TaxID=1898978 RepID=UPI002EDA3933